jgi:dihydrofolate synthase/folylpolyglutamate synthase
MGTSLDKDISGMASEFALLQPEVIVTASRHPRALSPEKLAQEWSRLGFTPQVLPDVFSALEVALSRAEEEDLILATGSLFVAAEAIEALRRR